MDWSIVGRATSTLVIIIGVAAGGVFLKVALIIFIVCAFWFSELAAHLFRKHDIR